MPNYGDDYEKAKIAAGQTEAQFQRPPEYGLVGAAASIPKGYSNSVRDDSPQPFVTMAVVYDHLNVIQKLLYETDGMATALCEKLDGGGNRASAVNPNREPTNVVEALEYKCSEIENIVRGMSATLSDVMRRVL